MALAVADRVQETTTTTGTGTYTLAGAKAGFQSFAAVGDGNTTYYACTDGTDYEVGIGTYTASGTTLARTTIIESSNSDAAVSWSAGEKDIFVTLPASKAVIGDASNNVAIAGELIVDSYNETYGAITSSSNATTVDCEAGNVFSHTLTENTTFTFSNPPASGTAYAFALRVVQDASASGYVVTWPSSVDWASATAPTLTATASAVDWLVFSTVDGGTTWYGFVSAQALG